MLSPRHIWNTITSITFIPAMITHVTPFIGIVQVTLNLSPRFLTCDPVIHLPHSVLGRVRQTLMLATSKSSISYSLNAK